MAYDKKFLNLPFSTKRRKLTKREEEKNAVKVFLVLSDYLLHLNRSSKK